MTKPVKIINFGGAKIDANQVASSKTEDRNGKTYYVINFKDGATVKYPKQVADNNARISLGRGEARSYVGSCHDSKAMENLYDKSGTAGYENLYSGEGVIEEAADRYLITQFWGLEFTGSKKPDDVKLRGCTRCTVDLRGGNSLSGDFVCTEKSTTKISKDNEVIMDDKDSVIQNGQFYDGPGISHEGHDKSQLE